MVQVLRQLKPPRPRKGISPRKSSTHPVQKPYFYIPETKSSRGSALVMAAIFMLVATTLITVGMKLISQSSQQAKQRELFIGEAENVARAGLIDAKGWFIRKGGTGGLVYGFSQAGFQPGATPGPVINPSYTNVDQAFNPVFVAANPQASDTTDDSIGIVAEYPLNSSVTANATLWARYEIKRQQAGPYDPNAVHDVTGIRNSAYVSGDGYVWNIVCTGYVYKRMDKTTVGSPATWVYPYNYGVTTGDYSKTKIIATARFSTELRKLSLVMPVPVTVAGNPSAGLYVQDMAAQITLNSQTLLSGAVSAFGTYAAAGENHP